MRTFNFLPLAILLATTSMSAQVKVRFIVPTESVCGPIALRAQMVDASDTGIPSQRVKITLKNPASKPIVLERFTIHFETETPTAQDRFGTETRIEIGAKQETVFAETSSVKDPISYVVFDSVKYADGSIWSPDADRACKVVPDPR
jgi:hypothetical protein